MAFGDIVPGIKKTAEDKKEIIETVLNNCCRELKQSFENNKRPTKRFLKEIIIKYMDTIRDNPALDTANKDFGYELCWYLSEKAGLNLKLSSNTKIWGYWTVDESKQVKTVSVIRKRKTGRNTNHEG